MRRGGGEGGDCRSLGGGRPGSGRTCPRGRRPRRERKREAPLSLPGRDAAARKGPHHRSAHLRRRRHRGRQTSTGPVRRVAGSGLWPTPGVHRQNPVQLYDRSECQGGAERPCRRRARGAPVCRRRVRRRNLRRHHDVARSAAGAGGEQYRGRRRGADHRPVLSRFCSELDPTGIKVWRRSERQRLLALRTGAAPVLSREWGRQIEARLQTVLAERSGITLGVYWPFKAEFDPRPLVNRLIAEGFAAALPVVVDKKGPLEYRSWRPGDPLIDGVWGIPIPEKHEITLPQVVLAPLVGFDQQCYRLGYGGGYFDRTLAALAPRPLAIGIGFAIQLLETIHPQPFDVPMDLIVTEVCLRRR